MRANCCFSHALRLGLVLAVVAGLSGCQSTNGILGGTSTKPKPSAQIVVWQDPADPASEGTNVRDVDNDPTRFVVIGTDGQVDFVHNTSFRIAQGITADVQSASIQVGTGTIDIRFGLAPGNTTDRRPYLVDRVSGNFIQLVGGTNDVTFEVTTAPFENPDDASDDRAVDAGAADNPLVQAASPNSAGTNALNKLCGIGGAAMMLPTLLGMLGLRFAHRRWR